MGEFLVILSYWKPLALFGQLCNIFLRVILKYMPILTETTLHSISSICTFKKQLRQKVTMVDPEQCKKSGYRHVKVFIFIKK